MKTKIHLLVIALGALTCLSTLSPQLSAAPLGTAFTYQGQLTDGTNPANGRYDLTFTLYDESAGGRVVAGPLTNSRLNVIDGLFTVTLDFRADVFGSQARWLGITVRPSGAMTFTPLSPRQQFMPAPQALYAANAGDAAQLGGQSASDYVAKAGDTMTGPLVVPANGFRAGTDQLVLTGGNVGIGTTSPGALLGLEGGRYLVHARGSSSFGAWLSLESTATGGERWDFVSTGDSFLGGAGNLLFRQEAVGSVLTLTPAGRAGVGTLSPIAKLDVVDEAAIDTLIRAESSRTTGSTLALVNSDTGGKRWDIISTGSANSGGSGHLQFRQAGADPVLALTPAGDVGVGTLSPTAKLHVGDEAGTQPVLIRAESPRTGGSCFSLVSTDTGGRSWYFTSSGSGTFGGPGKLMVKQGGNTPLLVLDGNQRAGINNTDPQAALDVVTRENENVLSLRNPYGYSRIVLTDSSGSQGLLTCHTMGGNTLLQLDAGEHWLHLNSLGWVETDCIVACQELVEQSDLNRKADLEAVSPVDILERVVSLPINTWAFTNAVNTRHLGPMAQDFHAAFGLGKDDTTISPRDVASVGLAAIQGLNQIVESGKQKTETRMETLETENATLKQELAELKALVKTLAAKVNGGGQ